jgi:4-hydroxy-3-methylbut-2-enyl diphosphate reductase IspH
MVLTNFLVRLALPQDRRHLGGEFCRDADLLQDLAELPNQFFLANVRVAAGAAVPRAVVVDVLTLLDLRLARCAIATKQRSFAGMVSSRRAG